MRSIPKRKNLAEIVAEYGGLKAYLNNKEIMAKNNGLGYDQIMLLLSVSVSAAADKTGRRRETVYNWRDINNAEQANAKIS